MIAEIEESPSPGFYTGLKVMRMEKCQGNLVCKGVQYDRSTKNRACERSFLEANQAMKER
jgi:hypothetical protein